MPVYNAELYIKKAIESILSQTESDFEFIIVNDGSSDQSEEIIKAYQDPRIRYFKKENGGDASARNVGLDQAKGEWITWQDADDVSLPNRLEMLKKQFVSDQIGIAHSDMLLINHQDLPIGYLQAQNIPKERLLRFFLKVGTPFNNASMMWRREAIGSQRFDTSLKVGSDTDLVFRLAAHWESVHVPEPLIFYRRHINNLSHQTDYPIYYAHMKKFLTAYQLNQLIPELPWDYGNNQENRAMAYALMALFLFRRSMILDVQEWIEKAQALCCTEHSYRFILSIGCFLNKSYQEALNYLLSCMPRDHIIENYIGEAYALQGDLQHAHTHFMHSLQIDPNYIEPMENVKFLGVHSSLNFVEQICNKLKG
jgi:glycosyltransferase involved in cell wall biosynthesis